MRHSYGPEEGFGVDRHAAAGRKSHCKACDRKRRKGYYAAHKDEWSAQRAAAREAAWQAELEAQVEEHRKRVAAALAGRALAVIESGGHQRCGSCRTVPAGRFPSHS
jgi:hypothetical protein